MIITKKLSFLWVYSLFLLFIFLLVAVVCLSTDAAAPLSDQKNPPETIKVVMDNNYPPYVFLDGKGNLQGILIDQWRLWEQKTGIRADISGMDWDEALTHMGAGEFDVIDTIFFNERRAQIFDFSKPYAKIDVSIFFHKSISGISGADSLQGFAVAVKSGDNAIDHLRGKGISLLQEYPSYEAIVRAAKEQKVMVTVIDNPPALYFLYKMGILDQFRYSAPLYTGEFHRAVRKGNGAILKSVEEGFSKISESEYHAIKRKWFGTEARVYPYLRHIATGLGALVVIALFLIVWNYTLRKKVHERTIRLEEEIALNIKKTEALQVSEEKYRELVENANSIILRMDATGTITFFNEYASRFLGFSRDEVIGRNVVGTIVPSTDSSGKDLARMILDIGFHPEQYKSNENENVCKDGTRAWVAWTNKPILDDQGQCVEIMCIGNDITSLKQTDEALRWKTALLEAQVNTSIDGILVIGEKQRRIIINQRIIDLWDVPQHILDNEDDAVLLQHVVGLVKHPEQFLEKVIYLYSHPYETSRDEIEFKSGMVLDQYSAPVLGKDGKYYGRIWTFRDMTERKEANRELEEREEEYRLLFKSASSGIFIAQDNKLKIVNPAAVKIAGYSAEDLITKPFTSFIHPDDISMVVNRYTRRLQGETAETNYPFRIVTAEGVARWVEITSVPTLWKGRAATLNYMIDITERKRAEDELRESEALLKTYLENAPDGIYMSDMKGNFLYGNRKYEEIIGYRRDELIGKHILELNILSKKSLDKAVVLFQTGIEGKSTGPDEIELINKEGRLVPVEINTTVVQRKDQGIVLAFVRDITSRKHAEGEITREREKLKTLSDNAPFGMVLIDKEGHFTYINRKFTELFGYDVSDVPDGRTWCRKAYPEAESRHTVISTWREDLKETKPAECIPRVFTVICKDGKQKIAQFITSVLISGDYLMTCEDITEMRQLESQLRQAQRTEAIGTLAGGIAHDFNNILTALMGYAGLIQIKMNASDPLRTYVDEILTASEKAVDLTQSLLTFSRRQSVTLMPLNMNNAIKVAEKLLRRLLTEDIEFCTFLTDDDTIVMADKSQMDQILFNLVTNARDAMPKGGALTIKTAVTVIDNTFIKTHGFGEAGKYVLIHVSDTGTGMDEITQQKIFDPFFTTKEAGKGTGLGLATVYGIVRTHNGFITVESILNQGTTFHVYLPAIKMKIDETEDTAIPMKGGKETILIAEDNTEARQFMREALQGYDYTIREATDGEDAVEKVKQHRDIDLIIIDSVMPKKNGRETYEEIHGIDPHIKVLFTSGYTKDIVLDKGIEEKEFDFIAKPMSLSKLLQKVREVLDK